MTINNNNIFGAFTLNEARGSRLTGDWLNKESVANYGWFGGGISAGTPLATVDRIDFSNDSVTATARSPLSLARYTSGATGNSNYGWFGGGQPGSKSTVDRIDYSNDSSTASPRGPLSLARYQFIATGNSNYGWFGGGRDTPSTSVSTVDRIDFSNDASTASPRGPLSGSRYDPAAIANSNYGWFGGGYNPPSPGSKSTVDRIDFSNDSSTATARGPLSVARRQSAATGNSNYGWFGGGRNTIILSTVERIDFSNDLATASPRGGLLNAPAGIYLFAATGNSNYGWFGGGLNGPTPVATVDRIDFSNDSVTASPRGALTSPGRYGLAATSGVLNIRRQKAANFGWFGGGAFPPVATVDRIDFSNDLVSALARGSLTLTRTALSATGNSNYGWFGGGYNPSLPTPERFTRIVDRIDFSNDSPSTLTRGPLSAGRAYLAATGNSNYGWFGGGRGPGSPIPLYTTVDRIDFSNDSSTALPRGSLTSPARYALSATGNSNYGWFGGGNNPALPIPQRTLSTVDRIDFSNDNATASPRGPLTLVRYLFAATGNSNYGWFGGGVPSQVTVDRIDFSNDSATALLRGPLSSSGRFALAATGNSNYGWFGGGKDATSVVTVDRIDFSNDSVTASPRGTLSAARYGFAATSNTQIG